MSIIRSVEGLIPLDYKKRVVNSFLKFAILYWRRINKDSNPRRWSNDELRKIARYFHGNVINIAGGEDKDKEDGFYKDYFTNADSYVVSNYPKQYSETERNESLFLDLTQRIANDSPFYEKYDVVFTHTVLEHIYELEIAVSNLCRISKDIIITVVPFIQSFHHKEPYYHDYWRFTPYSLYNLFKFNGFYTIYCTWNNDPLENIYLFHIASKNKEKWRELTQICLGNDTTHGPGYSRQTLLSHIQNKTIQDMLIKSKDIIDI